ncbi:MAG: AAA family ATPase [Lachnospiraceae bacterium]
MKIQELNIKNFGKFSNTSLFLQEGLNVIYGENESGKTTLHTFIKGMLFGMERGRGRASVNDTYSIYEPWVNPNYYAGNIRFECGGKSFRIDRNFDKYSKKASLVCEDDGEQLSLERGDLNILLEGMDIASYENTIAIGQLKVETNQSLAVELKNYATNYYTTGNSNMNLDGALQVLKGRKKENEKFFKENAKEKEEQKGHLEQEASYVWREINQFEQELKELKKERAEGIARIERIEQEEKQKQRGEQEKNLQMEVEQKKKNKLNLVKLMGIFLLLIPIYILVDSPWKYLCMCVVLLIGVMDWQNQRKKNSLVMNVSASVDKPVNSLEDLLQNSLKKIEWKVEHLELEMKEKQVLYGNIQEQLEELEEESDVYKDEMQKKLAIQMAIDELLKLSGEIQKELSQDLNNKTSEILSFLTKGKYTQVLIDEELHMHLFTKEHRISIEQVSRGTIEQIYFALRMAASELLYKEEYPVILDDTFVFYDDKRLEKVLRWLSEHKKQVLLFTCQRREIETLERLNIKFALHCDTY